MRMQKIVRVTLCATLLALNASAFCQTQENTPLYFGNPSGASTDPACAENYLMEKPQFTLSYNATRLIPNWVAWHLCPSDLGSSGRAGDFHADASLPEKFYHVQKKDYQFVKYGFDRGHLCPSADRSATKEDNAETFLMTNMIPQSPDVNRITWRLLEEFERELCRAGNELYIFAGGAGTGGTSAQGTFSGIPIAPNAAGNAAVQIAVPAFCWKILLILPEGDGDKARLSADTMVIAVYMPNAQGIQNGTTWQSFLVSIDFIEEKTGFDFFSDVEEDLQAALEAKIYCP